MPDKHGISPVTVTRHIKKGIGQLAQMLQMPALIAWAEGEALTFPGMCHSLNSTILDDVGCQSYELKDCFGF